MEQKRLVIWVLLSIVILTAWSYFVPQSQPENNQKPQTNVAEKVPDSNLGALQPQASPPAAQNPPAQLAISDAETVFSQRIVTISTPLYEAKFDTKGAVPISWIIKKNKDTNRPIFGFNHKPLFVQASLPQADHPLRCCGSHLAQAFW